MGLEDGTSPQSGSRVSYLHGSGTTPPYLGSYSPPPMGSGHSFKSYPDNIVYTSIGSYKGTNAFFVFLEIYNVAVLLQRIFETQKQI